jgi:membrane protease YdiL (CAAX protease family)
MKKILLIFILICESVYSQNTGPAKDSKSSKDVEDSKQTKDSKSSKDVEDSKQAKDSKSSKDVEDSKQTKDSKSSKDVEDSKQTKDSKSSKDVEDSKQTKDSKSSKDVEDSKQAKDSPNTEPSKEISSPTPTENQDISKENTKPKKNPKVAALLGIIPGVGQAYIGNYYTGAFQMGLFLGLNDLRWQYARRVDYIPHEQRLVEFKFEDALVAEELKKQNYVYSDVPYKAAVGNQEFYKELEYGPIFSETRFDRDSRLIRERKLAEENLLFKYGTYQRESRSSHRADTLSNPILSTMMYSVYSSFRDAGGLGEEKKSETIGQLAYSPFNIDYLKRPNVFIPILLITAIAGLGNQNGNPILVPPSLKKDGSLYASAFINGISPGVGEEAFFRGYVNYSLVNSYGANVGIGGSSLLFMLAHEGNPDASDGRLSRLLAGIYLGYIHYKSNFDIKPGIAVHFWWNFIIGLSMIQNYKGDSGFEKSPREVYYMPIQYSFTF